MSDRDELAATIKNGGWPSGSEHFYSDDAADAVIAAGWRKKPSRGELKALFVGDQALHYLAPRIADAVLALLDGPTETGGK